MDIPFELRTALTIVTISISSFLVYFVSRYGKNSVLKYIFLAASVGLIGWLLSIYLPFHTYFYASATLLSRLGLFFGVIFSYSIVLLLYHLCNNNPLNKKFFLLFTVISLAYLPLTLSRYFFEQTVVVNNEAVTKTGPLMFLFALYAFFAFAASMYILVCAYSRSEKEIRKQVLLLVYGTVGMYGGMLFAVMIPVILTGNAGFIQFGSLFVLFFMFMITLAIARYGLFDIRLVSMEILVFTLNLFLLFQIFLTPQLTSYKLDIFIFVFALIVSYVFVRTAQHETKLRAEHVRMDALEDANQKLKVLDAQKTDFITLAAHQLRTPLSVINGYLELIKEGAYGKAPKGILEVLNHVDENSARVVTLVDQFLSIAKLEEGLVESNFTSQDFMLVVKELIAEERIRASQKKIKINLQLPKSEILATFDKQKIRQAMENILDNAIRYSEKGTITITVNHDDEGVLCTIQDEGLGFNPNEVDAIFQKFYRGSNVKTVEVNGTGIGLYIAKKFIEMHHGRIWGRSNGLNQGSEFGFWIPYQQPNT